MFPEFTKFRVNVGKCTYHPILMYSYSSSLPHNQTFFLSCLINFFSIAGKKAAVAPNFKKKLLTSSLSTYRLPPDSLSLRLALTRAPPH